MKILCVQKGSKLKNKSLKYKLFSNLTISMGILLTIFTAGCKIQEVNGNWAAEPITIDGRNNDWPEKQGIFFSEQNAALSISNDNEFLYILFRTTDAKWARIIKMTGLNLSFNNKGNKDKDISLQFRGGPTEEEMRAVSGESSNRLEQMSGRMRNDQGYYDQIERFAITIKDEVNDELISPDGDNGPAVAFDTCQGFYTYEIRIPLESGTDFFFGLGANPGERIGLGAVWGDMGNKKRTNPSDMNSTRGGSGGGRGGRGGNKGGGRAGMGGRGENRPETPKKQEIWIKTQLSLSPENEISNK